MIIKVFTGKIPVGVSSWNPAACAQYKATVIADLTKRVSPKALAAITEKFLVPQQWKATVKAVTKAVEMSPEDDMEIEGAANVIDPDRGREVIVPSAWKLDNFEKNPIILFMHNHSWPIGYCVEYKVEDNGLYYRASIGKPKAYGSLTECQTMCRQLLAQGILRASSVGFLPLNLEYDEENDILRYTEVELLEISLVSVPMQQGSLLDSVGPAAKNITTKSQVEVKKMTPEEIKAMMDGIAAVKDLCQKTYDAVTKEAAAEGEAVKEAEKKLKTENAELKTKLDAVTKEKTEVETEAKALVEALEKNGIKLD